MTTDEPDRERFAHLDYDTSDRGFRRLPIVTAVYGGEARVYESSAASGPHVWLNVKRQVPPDAGAAADRVNVGDVTLHLSARAALALAEQLLFLLRQHYQGDQLFELTGTEADRRFDDDDYNWVPIPKIRDRIDRE